MVKCLDYLPGWSWVPNDHTRTVTKSSRPRLKAGLLKHNQHLLGCTHTRTHIWAGAGNDQVIKQIKICYQNPQVCQYSQQANIMTKTPWDLIPFKICDFHCSTANYFISFLGKQNRKLWKTITLWSHTAVAAAHDFCSLRYW